MQALLDAYRKELIGAIESLDTAEFAKFIDLLVGAYRSDNQVFIVGNGGSAGTANHFVCDFGKNAVPWDKRRFRIHSLCDNVEVITALGNDIAFDQIFSFQMGNAMRPGDVLILISASGNSPDLVSACEKAKEIGAKIIALCGFGGGKIAPYADARLVSDLRSYERVEDLHLMITHMIVCWFKANADKL